MLESGGNRGHVPVAPWESGAIHGVKRELMKAVGRLGLACAAGMLALSPAAVLAQQAPPANTTGGVAAPDAVGPGALQNFSLTGTVTKPADSAPAQSAPSAPRPKPVQTRKNATPITTASDAAPPPRAAQPRTQVAVRDASHQHSSAPPADQQAANAPLVTAPVETAASAPPAAAPTAADFPAAPQASSSGLPANHGFTLLPWLLAAIALGAGGAFLFWRNRSREAFAGGPHIDAFVAPEPAPAPRARPAAPPEAAPPRPSPGIVSTRLRPWVEIGIQPLRCVLDGEKVTFEFDLELFNSGSAPARGVLAEASLLNAGAQQGQEIGRFFANPVGEGERIPVIAPLQRLALKTQVSIPRELVVPYDMAGRQVFVPLIAFNALYDWSAGHGQTSAAYLLGRDTKGEKLAPFRLDVGPRIFRGLAARLLPDGVRQ
jgi:hypothetical protein